MYSLILTPCKLQNRSKLCVCGKNLVSALNKTRYRQKWRNQCITYLYFLHHRIPVGDLKLWTCRDPRRLIVQHWQYLRAPSVSSWAMVLLKLGFCRFCFAYWHAPQRQSLQWEHLFLEGCIIRCLCLHFSPSLGFASRACTCLRWIWPKRLCHNTSSCCIQLLLQGDGDGMQNRKKVVSRIGWYQQRKKKALAQRRRCCANDYQQETV